MPPSHAIKEMNQMKNVLRSLFTLTLLFSLTHSPARAKAQPPMQVAEQIRASLFQAQINIPADLSLAEQEVKEAQSAYQDQFEGTISAAASEKDELIRAGFEQMELALINSSASEFA